MKAQTDEADKKAQCNSIMKATYVFEGKVDSSKYFTIKTGEYTYANFYAYLVEVKKVIKGNIQKGTIEIFTPAPGDTYKGPNGIESYKSAEGYSIPPVQGLYLCWDKTKGITQSCYANSNTKTLSYYDGIKATNGVINKNPDYRITEYFSTLADLYAYISANYGVQVNDK